MTTGKTRPPFANVTDQALILNEAEIDNASDGVLEDAWLDFAMSETPLTCPQQKNDGGGGGGSFVVQRSQTIPYSQSVPSPETSTNNGVGGGNGESSRAVRRRLFEDPMEPNNAAVGRDGQTETEADPIEAPTTAGPSVRMHSHPGNAQGLIGRDRRGILHLAYMSFMKTVEIPYEFRVCCF
ncbi:hypothetical protein YC2023_014908 [Brassica napus]